MSDQQILFKNTDVYDGPTRTDQPVYPVFASIYKSMQKRFWVPETISMGQDKADFKQLPQGIQDIVTANISWQVFADSDQDANLMHLISKCNNIELKRCLTMQLMEEDNHSGSYQYIINSMYDDPTKMLDEMENHGAVSLRRHQTTDTGVVGNGFTMHPAIRMLALEGISFTTSFLTTLSVNHLTSKLNGTRDSILKIAADESGHLVLWSNVVKILLKQEVIEEDTVIGYFAFAILQELQWCKYLYELHPLPELENKRMQKFLEYKADQMLRGVGIDRELNLETPAISNWYQEVVKIDNQQVEGQAANGIAYVSGGMKDDW